MIFPESIRKHIDSLVDYILDRLIKKRRSLLVRMAKSSLTIQVVTLIGVTTIASFFLFLSIEVIRVYERVIQNDGRADSNKLRVEGILLKANYALNDIEGCLRPHSGLRSLPSPTLETVNTAGNVFYEADSTHSYGIQTLGRAFCCQGMNLRILAMPSIAAKILQEEKAVTD